LSKIVLTTIAGGSVELGDIPFNLYAKGNTGGMVLFCRPGFAITPRHMEALRRSDRVFYISSAEIDNYLDYAFDRLEKIVSSDTIQFGEKARIVRGVGKRIVRMLLEDPRSGESIKRSSRFVDSQLELILGSPEAAIHLFALSAADPYALSHSINVSTFCILLGQQLLGESREELQQLGLGGLLHDIGKTQLDSRVLVKRTPLTENDFQEIRRHPGLSAELIEEHHLPQPVRIIGRSHHEMADGSGYPDGLHGDSIHPFARIAAVANAYDGMTSDRQQHSRMPHLQALSIMAQKIKRYDSKVFHALLRIVLRDDRLIEGFLSKRIKFNEKTTSSKYINPTIAAPRADL
jgi:HD-GYP domain-containing protein (c-di-GMP phosphodiesterase class II)